MLLSKQIIAKPHLTQCDNASFTKMNTRPVQTILNFYKRYSSWREMRICQNRYQQVKRDQKDWISACLDKKWKSISQPRVLCKREDTVSSFYWISSTETTLSLLLRGVSAEWDTVSRMYAKHAYVYPSKHEIWHLPKISIDISLVTTQISFVFVSRRGAEWHFYEWNTIKSLSFHSK